MGALCVLSSSGLWWGRPLACGGLSGRPAPAVLQPSRAGSLPHDNARAACQGSEPARGAGSVLVIGCGNIDRGDDAAGILVARRLRERGIAALEHSRDGLALMESWAGAERVILVDAVQTGAPPGTVTEWDGRTAPVSAGAAGTHGFGVAGAIQLARVLDRLPPSLAIFGIEAARFTPGRPPCPEVEFAVEEVARRIILEVEHA